MRKLLLAAITVMLSGGLAVAQGFGTGGGGGGGGTGGGGSGGSGSGGFSGGFGQNQGGAGAATGTAGSTQGFSGNLDAPTAFGQTTGATAGGSKAGAGIPTQINPFQAFYSNPQALGMQLVTIKTTATGTTTSQIAAFGQPIFATTTTTNAATAPGRSATGSLTGTTGNFGTGSYGGGLNTGALGGAVGVGGVGGFGATSGLGATGGAAGFGTATASPLSYALPPSFTTIGVSRAAPYITTLGFTPPKAAPGKLQADLQQVAMRSELLTTRNVQLVTDGATVVLRGQVADERERRLAEGIVRLTPGVREVRNEIIINGQ